MKCPYCANEGEECICKSFDKLLAGRKRNWTAEQKKECYENNLKTIKKMSEEITKKPKANPILILKKHELIWKEKVREICAEREKNTCVLLKDNCKMSICPKYGPEELKLLKI